MTYITNYDNSVLLPYEDGLLEWLIANYPYSKYRLATYEVSS